MTGSSPKSAGSELFDVVILGFEPRPEPATEALRRIFGLDAVAAQTLVHELPATVRRAVNPVQAEYFRRALGSIGALVEVRDAHGLLREQAERTAPVVHAAPVPRVAQALMDFPPLAHRLDSYAATISVAPTTDARHSLPLTGADAVAPTLHFQSIPANDVPRPSKSERVHDWDGVHGPRVDIITGLTLSAETRAPLPNAELEESVLDGKWGQLEPRNPPVAPPRQQPVAAPENALHGGLELLPRTGSVEDMQGGDPPPPRRVQPAAAGWIEPQPVIEPVPPPRAAPVPRHLPPQAQAVAVVLRRDRDPLDPHAFWRGIVESLVLPFLGTGVTWLVGIGLWCATANLLAALLSSVPFLGIVLALMTNASVLALSGDLHQRCMWAVVNAEPALDETPDLEPTNVLQRYVVSGAHLTLFGLLSQLPLVAWFAYRFSHGGAALAWAGFGAPPFWLLSIVPAFYWPMGIATASLAQRFGAVWDVRAGLRAIGRAPVEYVAIVMIGAGSFMLPWLFCAVAGRTAGLSATFVAATAGLPIAASHAVMGALTGQLLRARPELFD